MSATYTERTGEAGKCGQWFRWAANGNVQAEAWLWAYWNFSQMLDDLVDGDRAVSQQQAARALYDFWTQCAVNGWFAAHSAALWLPVAQSIERWVAADRWPNLSVKEQAQRQMLRHGDLEVVMAVAIACGGLEHALTGGNLRTLDPEGAEEQKTEIRKPKSEANMQCEYCAKPACAQGSDKSGRVVQVCHDCYQMRWSVAERATIRTCERCCNTAALVGGRYCRSCAVAMERAEGCQGTAEAEGETCQKVRSK